VIKKSKKPAAKKRPTSISSPDAATILTPMLEGQPGVTVQEKFHHSSYLVREKVFAFTRPEGVVLKLPEARIRELMETRHAAPLVMGKRVMREWVVLREGAPASFRKDKKLFLEAMAFVASLAK
jgi:hypothetical protein